MALDLGGRSSGHSGAHDARLARHGARRVTPRLPGTTLLYERVVALVEQLIAERELVPGDLLPSYTDLAEQAGVSLITVRRALDELEKAGRVRRHQGLGTFVAQPRRRADPASAGSMLASLVKGAQVPTIRTQVIELRRGEPSADLCRALRIEPTDQVWRLCGLGTIDGEPVVLETSVIPVRLAPTLGQRIGQSCGSPRDLLAATCDLAEAYQEQYLEVTAPTQDEAGLLELPPHALVVRVCGLSVDGADVPFDCFERSYPAGRFAFGVFGTGTRPLLPAAEHADWRVSPQVSLNSRASHHLAGAPSPRGRISTQRCQLCDSRPVPRRASGNRAAPLRQHGPRQLAVAEPVRRVQVDGPAEQGGAVRAAKRGGRGDGVPHEQRHRLVRLARQEDGVHEARVRLGRVGVAVNHRCQLRPGKQDDRRLDVELSRYLGFELPRECLGVGARRAEHDVAGLDVGGHVTMAERVHHLAQVGHQNLAATSYVNAAQQGNMSWHDPILPAG
jgi:DNA-binding GntR family transcriptional regulator